MENFHPEKHQRLEWLMSKNTEGTLTNVERSELVTLIRAAERLILANARELWVSEGKTQGRSRRPLSKDRVD